MACGSYICPGGFTVYRNILQASNISPLTDLATVQFTRVPEILSWTLEPSVDEPNAFRTADTNNVRVTPCPGTITWSATITVKYCETAAGWLFNHIMDPANQEDGWFEPGNGQPAWWYFSWDGNPPAGANLAPTDHGFLLYGTPNPPSFGGDNDTDEAAGGEWTIAIARGPFIPELA